MFGFNSGYVEDVYAQYLQNPESVSESWRDFFADFDPKPAYSAPGGADTSGDGAPEAAASAPAADASSAAPPAPARPAPPSGNGAAGGDGAPASLPARLQAPTVPLPEGAEAAPIRGVGARIVENMEASLTIPTATSVREIAVRLLAENRRLINRHQRATGGAKVSFTHLIAHAILRGMEAVPGMKAAFREQDGAPERIEAASTALGLAIDIEKRGKRQLLVPNIKEAAQMSFAEFLGAYNDVVKRARGSKLAVEDFQGTTATLTNPGGIGTIMSVPRLMPGQSVIVAVGAIGYPPEYAGMAPEELSRLGLSEVMTMTSTYDHRVIQGAESGEFLNVVAGLLQGEDGFYDDVFQSLGLHLPPFRGAADSTPSLGTGRLRATGKAAKIEKQARVYELIRAYRVRGHLLADTNPLGYEPRNHTELDPASYGLTVWDLDREFLTGGMAGVGGGLAGKDRATLREILDILWDTYTGHVGSEFMHLSSPAEKRWLIERIEPQQFREPIDPARKTRIFEKLNEAEALEQFIHTKYIGHKRFSLEGAETMVPLLDAVLSDAADQETEEVVIGMAHRGRLNVLTNILGKPYDRVFGEFEGTIDPDAVHGSGDVKYHLGQTGTHTSPSGATTELTLASNPSHLEAVNPVVEGMVRAKQQRIVEATPDASEKQLRDRVLPVLIHGDAAFAGQGVVAETLNLSQLEGYRTGGTVHLVVNNQIGFTTLPMHSRSSVYATDIARMIQAPIFHVNGDDPEAAVRVARLALDYRQVFNKDVVVDLVCYRKYGHNEGDEPSYTQPLMYAEINGHRSVRKLYLELLLRRGELTPEQAEGILDDFKGKLDGAFEETKELAEQRKDLDPVPPPVPVEPEEPVATAAPRPALDRVIRALVDLPDDFEVHKKLGRLVVDRRQKQFEEGQIDWALAEALAFGTLLLEDTPVRLSGQDSGRGTFSQRHAILYDQTDGHRHTPLNQLGDGAAKFQVYDSLLSEYAALGFEYGYSVAEPEALVLWEAQFGDFVNGAQIMIDQFVTAAEAKWGQTSSLVMLLPHAYEGQGPEHSSGRLERFLQACAEDNLIVANYSTPSNYFHALRRQVKRDAKKPLIVMTPKSLLRHPQAVTSVEELSDGHYRPFIPSQEGGAQTAGADRLVICSGKVYYDVLKAREALDDPASVAIARLEQFYPFPEDAVREELARFEGKPVVWLQEEPANMGGWSFVRHRLDALLEDVTGDCSHRVVYAGRAAAASPAAGSAKVHTAEQERIVREALGLDA
ncbi:multifunctional oxoglutarate decarboxylase/oxoglutarate dehydrogenase thiamine pyrophosphate-binding subunit/dihydrolipoyllysine-residue succinyltransferase subunit [Rubrivirga litoralis]|uniref:oxoglutarate dehydrogenase (succinyl-transferring) n=1 Tax=Rubrivirga litoralis TaxID=3075598 RepID=A0ABU3BSR0_9BACT|nr:multifunctional oxoglutarate decarboxylase/oxoglutarate dehydrogenase thiamine pyrophosphate-binding subunit/dihydrolipoyllysine-residue succinyltransferase subunit [Rubrivirga sp. F394]MDT0632303.1 multifunctional oxoglutarate decarboxylase/oxoglutarate dehydrogenase thiamine pyrophosphate-binding subunit/dihydrolipoyllysine-residue succinyltransferase subunit [Rubrivirga sp. F394]